MGIWREHVFLRRGFILVGEGGCAGKSERFSAVHTRSAPLCFRSRSPLAPGQRSRRERVLGGPLRDKAPDAPLSPFCGACAVSRRRSRAPAGALRRDVSPRRPAGSGAQFGLRAPRWSAREPVRFASHNAGGMKF